MAIDETLRVKIRAVYESNNLSVAKVMAERFPDADVSVKTVESWVSKYSWKKNRYADYAKALENLLDENIEKQLIEKGKELLEAEVMGDDVTDDLSKEITKEAIRKAITGHSLVNMMGENLLRAEIFAKSSKSIGTTATFQAMLIQTYTTIHGKEVRHTFKDFDSKELTEEELKNLSQEELLQIVGELESED
jgi:hypothetical protein